MSAHSPLPLPLLSLSPSPHPFPPLAPSPLSQTSEAPGPGAYDISLADKRAWLTAPAPKFGKEDERSKSLYTPELAYREREAACKPDAGVFIAHRRRGSCWGCSCHVIRAHHNQPQQLLLLLLRLRRRRRRRLTQLTMLILILIRPATRCAAIPSQHLIVRLSHEFLIARKSHGDCHQSLLAAGLGSRV